MTWEELKEEAKKMQGVLICNGNSDMPEHIYLNELVVCKNGRVFIDDTDDDGYCCVTHTIAIHRTPNQMLAIMKALQ